MPEDYDLDEDLDNDEQPDERPKALRKAVDSANKRATEAEQRATQAERQLALRDSGLDMTNPQHKFFADNYEGDLTPEAVQTKARELGFLAEAAPAVPDEEVAQHAASAAVAAGAEMADADNGIGSSKYEQDMAEAAGKGRDAVLDVMKQYGSPFVEELI